MTGRRAAGAAGVSPGWSKWQTRRELAELEDQQALRVVKPGALQRAGLIRDLLALPLITRIIEHLAARGDRGQDWGSA